MRKKFELKGTAATKVNLFIFIFCPIFFFVGLYIFGTDGSNITVSSGNANRQGTAMDAKIMGTSFMGFAVLFALIYFYKYRMAKNYVAAGKYYATYETLEELDEYGASTEQLQIIKSIRIINGDIIKPKNPIPYSFKVYGMEEQEIFFENISSLKIDQKNNKIAIEHFGLSNKQNGKFKINGVNVSGIMGMIKSAKNGEGDELLSIRKRYQPKKHTFVLEFKDRANLKECYLFFKEIRAAYRLPIKFSKK